MTNWKCYSYNRVLVAPSAHKAANRVACYCRVKTWRWALGYKRYIERGKCACGECDADLMMSDGARCGYCGCLPTRHSKKDARSSSSSDSVLRPQEDGTSGAGTIGNAKWGGYYILSKSFFRSRETLNLPWIKTSLSSTTSYPWCNCYTKGTQDVLLVFHFKQHPSNNSSCANNQSQPFKTLLPEVRWDWGVPCETNSRR